MSEFTGSIQQSQDEASEAATDVTDNTEIVEFVSPPKMEIQNTEQSEKAPEEEPEETKGDEASEAATVTEDKPEESSEMKNVDVKPSDEGESEDLDVVTEQITQEIEAADDNQAVEAEETQEEQTAEKDEKEGEKQEEGPKEEELTEGEKMLMDIDSSKVREEADTELDYTHDAGADLELTPSRITLHPEELPEIRGLADLEYQSPEESQKEVTFESNIYLSKRRSVRPSMAYKFLQEEEAAERRRQSRKDAAKKSSFETEEEEEKQKEVEEFNYTREELYAMHEKLFTDIVYTRMKNRYLQRKCADFFKRRRMEHALKEEPEIPPDALAKYERKLDRLADLHNTYQAETEKISAEMDVLQKERDDKYQERDEGLKKALAREREIGIGLISTKTGKEIPDKVVDQLIRRQTTAASQISQLRLKFINFRDEIAEKSAELKSLDNIGDDLSLMDYEQLKIENRAHSDKLEEKEEELTKLRVKCRNAVQIMAHVREKSAALDADMDVLKEEYEEVHYQYIEIRERLNFYKTERDLIRNKTMKLKAESGLLTKPKLLQDMETSMQEVKLYEKTLQKVKNEYNEKTQQIRNLRKNIAYEMVMNKKQPKEKKKKTTAKFYQVRPTLIIPKLPTNFFDRMAANSSSVFDLDKK